jgi:hypothetical protein
LEKKGQRKNQRSEEMFQDVVFFSVVDIEWRYKTMQDCSIGEEASNLLAGKIKI